ncbi:MAG: hypothetical protein K6G16_05795 [Lachnospiraceae bacterium]|nr:hypothetical protein [Lachnospiraceae bacterium]
MNKQMCKRLFGICLSVAAAATLILSPAGAQSALANGEILTTQGRDEQGYPDFFGLTDRVINVGPGQSKKVGLYSRYNYTYYISTHSSKKTYCECDFKKGTKDVVIHIGEDEDATDVAFYFYVDDPDGMKDSEYCGNAELYVEVLVRVNPPDGNYTAKTAQKTAVVTSVAAPLPKNQNGTVKLVADSTIAMLYDPQGVAMASFSVSDGSGTMPRLILGAVVQQDKQNYFKIDTASKSFKRIAISASDKAVMTAKGYAGVCLNGVFTNWP